MTRTLNDRPCEEKTYGIFINWLLAEEEKSDFVVAKNGCALLSFIVVDVVVAVAEFVLTFDEVYF